MQCPKCKTKTQVTETRDAPRSKVEWARKVHKTHPGVVVRTRKCPTCGLFRTVELPLEVAQKLVEEGLWEPKN